MGSFHQYMIEYKKQLKAGIIQQAYQELMEFILALRTHFKDKYPAYSVSGSIYQGYMDMTYFACTPESLKERGLKIAVVFIHQVCRFEAWLAGSNKQVQAEYWQLFKDSGWKKYRVVAPAPGVDSIVEHILVDQPDFSDLDALTEKIEISTLRFIADIEDFLSQHKN